MHDITRISNILRLILGFYSLKKWLSDLGNNTASNILSTLVLKLPALASIL